MAALQYNRNAATQVALCSVVGLLACGLHGCDHEPVKSYVAQSNALAWRDEHFSNCTDAITCMQQFEGASQQATAAAAEQAKIHAEAAQAAVLNNGHLNWSMQQAVVASDQAATAAQQAAANAQAAAQLAMHDAHAQGSDQASQYGAQAQPYVAQAQQYGAQAHQYGAQAHHRFSRYASRASAALQNYVTPATPATTMAPVGPPAQYVTPAQSVPVAPGTTLLTLPGASTVATPGMTQTYWLALPKVTSESGANYGLAVKALPVAIGSSALVGVAAMALLALRRHAMAAPVASEGGDEAFVSRVEAGLE
eukprot:CAMPEP_0117515290 /NCGR_PEP_ID=MMETSP0784-20121206/30505_1 /TAXON_ID=39447 /ORGANISM="" /LENGTH=308 /DNA_ID=CAMNT_0005311105 /DNA_START=97 /DNA_END=1023 /DNA_ORIENTATION=+